MAGAGCSTSTMEARREVVCSQCGARYARLPGLRCPRCGNALAGCDGCQGCGHAPATPAGESDGGWIGRLRAGITHPTARKP